MHWRTASQQAGLETPVHSFILKEQLPVAASCTVQHAILTYAVSTEPQAQFWGELGLKLFQFLEKVLPISHQEVILLLCLFV